MDSQKNTERIFLVFAITTILWVICFSLLIGEIDRGYKAQILVLEQKIEQLNATAH